MSETVFANSRAVATAGTPHCALTKSTSAADMCIEPGQPPKPFPNYAMTSALQNGSSTVKFESHPVWTMAGHLAPSLPGHSGVKGGVKSGAYQGKIEPISCSPDVIVEGNGVVRMKDDTLHNEKNSDGRVADASELLLYLSEYLLAGLSPEEAARLLAQIATMRRAANSGKPFFCTCT